MKMMRIGAWVGALVLLRALVPVAISFMISIVAFAAVPESDFEELGGLAALILSWLPAGIEEVNRLAKWLEAFALVSVPVALVVVLLPLFLSWNRARLTRLRRFGFAKNRRNLMHLATLDLFGDFDIGYIKKTTDASAIKRVDFFFIVFVALMLISYVIAGITLALGVGPLGSYGDLIFVSILFLPIIFQQYRPRKV